MQILLADDWEREIASWASDRYSAASPTPHPPRVIGTRWYVPDEAEVRTAVVRLITSEARASAHGATGRTRTRLLRLARTGERLSKRFP